jgi:hypothetical protein
LHACRSTLEDPPEPHFWDKFTPFYVPVEIEKFPK